MATTAATTTNPASAIYSSLNTSGSGSSTSTTTSSTSEAQSRFLTLLTTQLKNQDPLNPMDNAQMTSQLAQISTVDGIERLNSTLSKMIDGQTQSQTLQAATLVGHGVLVPGKEMALSSGTGVAGFELAGPADTVKIEIKDANGLVVKTINLDAMKAGVQPIGWDGKTDSGAQAADGTYTIAVTAAQGGNKVKADPLQYGLVDSVSGSGSGINASVGRLGKFGVSEIKQIL